MEDLRDYQTRVLTTMRRIFIDIPDFDAESPLGDTETEKLLWKRLQQVKATLKEFNLLGK